MTRKLIGVIVTLLLVGFTVIGFAQKENALTLGGTGTINQLEQWRATSTPFSAITTAVNGKNIYIPRSSATTSALTATTLCLTGDTCIETWPIGGGGGGGSGFPVYVQNGGASLNTGTTTLNFTPNSFSLSENPADNFAIRISTTTLGLLTTNVGEGTNLYYTDTRARAAITENVTGLEFNTGVLGTTSGYFLPTTTRAANWDTAYSWGNHGSAGYLTSIATTTVRGMFSDTVDGLTYTSGTGVLSTDSGYVIPSTTRMTNADTAYSWGNHATQGYITDGNTNWDNSYGFITDGNSGWDNSYGFITDGNTGWDNSYGLITASTATATITNATSTNLAVTGRFSIFGTVATALSDLCTAITGGAGLCDGIDNTSSGAGSISTSTVPNTGELAYWTSPSTLSSVATGTLSESIDGVALSASRGLIGGSAALSLDSGYVIPTTTRLVNHDTAFGWGNHASQGYITDGNTNWDNSYGFITSASVPARDWTQSGGYLVPTSSIGVNLSSHSVLSSYSATNGSTTNATSTNLAITGALKFFTQVWSSLGDFVAYVRQQFSSSATGLTYNNSTGDLSLTAGYVIPTTTRAVNWDTAFGWGNHASQGYINDGNTGWDNTYGLITASTATATITNATTTNLRVGGNFSFGGVVGSAWSDFCTSITGSADLCDGSDATGGGTGDVTKVGTPVDNQVGVWTGDGTIEGDAGFTFDGGLNVTVADAENKVGLTITNNDTTNSPKELILNNAHTGTLGVQVETYQNSPSPAVGDTVARIDMYGANDTAEKILYGSLRTRTKDVTTGTEDSYLILANQRGGFDQTMLQVGGDNSSVINGIVVGDSSGAAIVQSWGNTDLTLKTGNATTGNITIVDGASGDIQVNPNGTGSLVVDGDVKPSANDGGALGTTALQFSDLFLAEGGVINWDNGDATLTQVGNEVTLAGADLTVPNATSTTSFFSVLGTFTNMVVNTLASFLNVVVTGLLDVGGGVLEIPNGTNPTADDPGEIAHDTTDNQLIVDDYVMARATEKIWGVSVASTSAAFINDALLKVPTELDGYTITAIRCSVSGGTSKIVAIEDESTNSTEDITCGTSVTSDDGSITNATVTAGEEMYIDFGATSGTVDYVTITVYGQWTRE